MIARPSYLALVALLLGASSAFADDRLDLSGTWKLKPNQQAAGAVVLSGRQPGPQADTYAVAVTLPDGTVRSLQGSFDGTTLRTSLGTGTGTGREPGASGASVGLARVIDRAPGESSETGPAPTTSERRPEAPSEGTYTLTTLPGTGGRPPVHRFDAAGPADPAGATPVERFGRMALELKVIGATAVPQGERLTLAASVTPEQEGAFTWTAAPADAVELAGTGAAVEVTGKREGQVTITCSFRSSLGDTREVAHPLTVGDGIKRVELTGLTYVSDHGVLRDYEADWGVGGSVFAEPEWTPSKQSPISHSMDTKVKVRLELKVEPADAAPTTFELRGDGPGGLDFTKTVELRGGTVTLELESTEALPRQVRALELGVTWTLPAAGVAIEPASTSNTVYVTVGAPEEVGTSPGITLKRMKKAVEAVGALGTLEPHRIVKGIISRWSHFNLRVAYRNAWELADDKVDPATNELVGADCQTIVRYTRDVIKQVGVPGTAQYVVIYAHCKEPAKGLESENARNHMTSPRQYHNDHFPEQASRRSWMAALVDGSGGLNNYEAALKFSEGGSEKYYPGGVNAVLSSPDEVIGVFTTMSWLDMDDGLKVMEHIHAYR